MKSVILLAAVMAFPQQRQLGEGRKRVALVVGNDAYTSLPALSNAGSDARAMSAALGRSGFQITLVENAVREKLENEVQRFLDKLDRGDVALFYYSGHGLQMRGENYLAPVDLAARDVVQARNRSVNALEVLERMELAGADLQIIILDACRNNPYGGRGDGQGLAPMKSTGKGTFIAYATAPGRTASDGVGKNGLYTERLLEAIQVPGRTLEEVFKRAGDAVIRTSGGNQIPLDILERFRQFLFQHHGERANAGGARYPSQAGSSARAYPCEWMERPLAQTTGGKMISSTFGGRAVVLICCLSTALALPLFAQPQGASDKKAVPDKPAAKPEQASAKSPGVAARTRVNPKDGQRYVWIPPGTFRMGCSPGDSECDADESPAHTVTISRGFWLGQTEVTVAAFQAFSRSTGTAVPNGQKADRHPVVGVTWDEAAAYCQSIGGRLPTEAEWEYAARGGVNAARYGGLDAIAWYGSNSGSTIREVATKQPNAYGLYDMLGNVWEWVADWFDENYYRNSPASDPPGPSSGQYRVLRGGSWRYGPGYTRASLRLRYHPSYRGSYVGFRCVWEIFSEPVRKPEAETAVVVQRCYDLLLWLLPKVEKFPRSFRFSVGDRLVGVGCGKIASRRPDRPARVQVALAVERTSRSAGLVVSFQELEQKA